MIDDEFLADTLGAAFPAVAVVYRFGSTVRGEERPGSDVDVAFLAEGPVDPRRRFEVQEALASQLHRDVDLVDLAAASTVLRMQVLSRGEAIRVNDAERRDRFEDLVFSQYARLNEERRAILEQVAREGTVYGG